MKEIKFRGFSREYGKWVYGDLITSPNGEIKNIMTNEVKKISDFEKFINEKTLDEKGVYFNNKIYLVDPDSIGQFTGVIDDRGNEMFEGDVIRETKHKRVMREFIIHDIRSLTREYDIAEHDSVWYVVGNAFEGVETEI